MSIKICVAGKICSGKSTLVRGVAPHLRYSIISFGGILRGYAERQELPTTREHLQRLGQEMIDRHGYDGFTTWCIEQTPDRLWEQPLIVDGLRHGAVYQCIQARFPRHVLVYCDCDPETQMTRLVERDGLSRDAAQRILLHSTESCIDELKPLAHLRFRPESSLDAFLADLDAAIANHS